jgi:Oligoendopeptidase F
MKRVAILLFILITMMTTSMNAASQQAITPERINQTIEALTKKFGMSHAFRIERGVKKTALLWQEADGSPDEFSTFCQAHFIADEAALEKFFNSFSRNMEVILGGYNRMTLQLREPLDLDRGEYTEVDEMFGGYNASAHLFDDLYANKLAFRVTLNFPEYSLSEKNSQGKDWSRREWAYARLGDMFKARVPAALNLSYSAALNEAEMYIASYNILMGHLRENNKALFPADMKLLSHWNLRDEIKADYADKKNGLAKQRMIAQVMHRIVEQTIPVEVINQSKYEWNPFTNELSEQGKRIDGHAEGDRRYQRIIDIFKEVKKQDIYYPEGLNTYIKRNFNSDMEVSVEEAEKLFVQFVSSPEIKRVAAEISKRLGRKLEPFDIWYDGFKSRSNLDQEMLFAMTRKRFPNSAAFERQMPEILGKLGFTAEKAQFLSERIAVDPSRGSGHAAGALMKGDKAHLRTRVPASGMDYKGFNIAMHEFGHNVEQTFSLYNVDYYMLNGVPNTAFTEALAFAFQIRDLSELGITAQDKEARKLEVLDNGWQLYEIMGVSLVDIRVWKWLYTHPEATATELKTAVLVIARDVWNSYYAPVLGEKDQLLLGVYSHMIAYPLYLSAYSFGHLIHFQLEKQLKGKAFGAEVERMFTLGRLTPDQWMQQATGSSISTQSILEAVDEVLR